MNKYGKRILAAVLILAVAATVVTWRYYGTEISGYLAASSGEDAVPEAAIERIPVVLKAVEKRHFEKRLRVQGTVQAQDSVLVSPSIPGPITDIFVDEGDPVTEGETDLFQIDKVKLEEAVSISRQDLAVAQCGKREAAANLESLRAQSEKAQIDYERFQRLHEKDAVTLDALEQQSTRYRMAKAGLDHAETLIDLAAEREKQAGAALAIAEKNLHDSLVKAPISGAVAMKMAEKGEFGSPGAPVFRIDSLTALEFSAFLPAEYYDAVTAGTTRIRLTVNGHHDSEQMVHWKSPVVQPVLRTFEMKCLLDNEDGTIAPGVLGEAEIILEEREGPGIPVDAVQIRTNGKVVFTVEQDTARMHVINTGLESDGWTQILDDVLKEGDEIVSMGQFLLEEGTPVQIQQYESKEGKGG